MSQITKKALALSLKELLNNKSLDKITIANITDACGVNRQTFYYHFKDIYDLIEWIYTVEASEAIGPACTYATWKQGFLHLFDYIRTNKSFVVNTYHSLSREHLESYLYHKTFELLMAVVNEKAQDHHVNSKDKSFIGDFYKYAFTGLILNWIREGMKQDPSDLLNHVESVIEGDIDKSLNNFEKAGH